MPKKDLNQMAAGTARVTTGQTAPPEPPKNAAAVTLGRLGGLKGGKARAAALSADERSYIAKKAAMRRWKKNK